MGARACARVHTHARTRTHTRLPQRIAKGGLGAESKHWSDKRLSEMKERDWRIFREDHDIRVKGGRVANPLRSWSEAKLSEPVMRAIEDAGYKKPTPIQMQAIPIGMMQVWRGGGGGARTHARTRKHTLMHTHAQRDIIGIAETGSGKTAAFTIPLLEFVMRVPDKVRVCACARVRVCVCVHSPPP